MYKIELQTFIEINPKRARDSAKVLRLVAADHIFRKKSNSLC